MTAETAEGLPEQISDRAIEQLEEDRFGHQDFVDRLLTIVRATETPANVALFGRWGSGKTGISNRLQAEVEDLDGFRFAYFDAFKFARLPLLRRFLVRLAHDLGGEAVAAEYRHLVYEREQRARLKRLSEDDRAALLRWGTRIVIALAAIVWLFNVAMIIASHEADAVLIDIVAAALPAVLPTAILAAFITLGGRYLTVSTTAETPSSEEQFESLFTRLLDEQGIGPGPGEERLVVFVDELDRCSADEVAQTLESLKTFLDVPGCIFVVAADQKVLEHALTRRVRQATPRDLTNPYYSAGSAYLDKIFQYQINLPPLFPGRLTGFALSMLDDVGGVWDEVASKEDVVSVLLPVHVRSPRRVKVLLNAFAQAFALALARGRSGRLDARIERRAVEVAKLVGLQTEFPLFAADLATHRDLPALVLVCAEALDVGEDLETLEEMQGVTAATRKRAIGFARGELATDESLHQADSQPEGGDADGGMRLAQRNDLVDYLRQTARVAGPGADLVHLEGRGLSRGIEAALAADLTELALTNRPELARERIEALPEGERAAALSMLCDLVRESRGNDADNAIRALLVAFPAGGTSMSAVAKDLLAAVARYDHESGLAEDELCSALDMAVIGGDRLLQSSILARAGAREEPLRSYALDRAADLLDDHGKRLGVLMAEEIVRAPEQAAERLAG